MKTCFFLVLISFSFSGYSQGFNFGKKEYQETDGYILRNNDSILGKILIPVFKNEIDYKTLHEKIIFIDDSGKHKYYPDDISGFGFVGGDFFGDFYSIRQFNGLSKSLFLKRRVDGQIQLLELKLDKPEYWSNGYAGGGSYMPGVPGPAFSNGPTHHKEVIKSTFFLRNGDSLMIRISINQQSDKITKRDLKEIMEKLPYIFKSPVEELNIWELSDLLENYNSGNKNKID